MTKEPIPQLPRRRFHADMFLGSMPRHIIPIAIKFEIMQASQIRDEPLIRVRFRPAQLVIEVNNRKDNPQLAPQLQQHPQQRHRINPAGNGHADAIPSRQQFLPPNVRHHALCETVHENMVHNRRDRKHFNGRYIRERRVATFKLRLN